MGALRSNAYISYLLIASTLALLGIYLYGSVIGRAWNQLVAVMVVFTIGPGAGGEGRDVDRWREAVAGLASVQIAIIGWLGRRGKALRNKHRDEMGRRARKQCR